MNPSILDRFYEPGSGRLTRATHELMSLFFNRVPWFLPFNQLVAMIQFLVAARQTTPDGEAAQRWEAKPDVKFDSIDPNKLKRLFRKLGYVDAVLDLKGRKDFDVVIVPGGTALPQWRRLTLLIFLWMVAGIRFKKLVFGTGRKFSPAVDTAAKLQGNPAGCQPFRPGTVLPTELTEDDKADPENAFMRFFWKNLQMPDELTAITPVYSSNPAEHLEGDRPLHVLVITIQPHMFHGPMYTRLAPAGSTVITVAPSAELGRHDNPYLADGWARDTNELLMLMQAMCSSVESSAQAS